MAISDPAAFYWPTDDERVCVIGPTGSGKTWLSLYILAHHSIDRRPWILIDSKRETMFRQLWKKGAFRSRLTVNSSVRWLRPGLYWLQIREDDDVGVDDFLWRVHRRGRIGIFIDEGHSVAPPGRRGSALRAILTQGRSLRIPLISQSQEPTNIETFLKSQAQHFISFELVDRDARVDVRRYLGRGYNPDWEVPRHTALWYSTRLRQLWTFRAPSDSGSILDLIASRVPKGSWWSG